MKRLNAVPVPAVGVAVLVGEVGKAGGGVLGLLVGGGGGRGGEGGVGEALPPLPRVENGLMVRLLWVGRGVYKYKELCESCRTHPTDSRPYGTSGCRGEKGEAYLWDCFPCFALAWPARLAPRERLEDCSSYPVKVLSGWTVRSVKAK